MNQLLEQYVLHRGPQHAMRWGESLLTLTPCRSDELPPIDLISSVRCVVLSSEQVLVVEDRTSFHITPGGRREPNESLIATLHRELGEETGWQIGEPRQLGWLWFHHESQPPPNYRYPYPDFLQVVYVAHATYYDPALKETNGYELAATFHPWIAPIIETLPEYQRWLLAQARELMTPRR